MCWFLFFYRSAMRWWCDLANNVAYASHAIISNHAASVGAKYKVYQHIPCNFVRFYFGTFTIPTFGLRSFFVDEWNAFRCLGNIDHRIGQVSALALRDLEKELCGLIVYTYTCFELTPLLQLIVMKKVLGNSLGCRTFSVRPINGLFVGCWG